MIRHEITKDAPTKGFYAMKSTAMKILVTRCKIIDLNEHQWNQYFFFFFFFWL
ncbi:unnamed protein product [Acanthoscelides obtectus]|uniref:Uncharacterized protein n=1 Tax=Acanthoscelides obtectus TaxID=200917 RepID=A0A9P0PNW7_ACAOB|nr:unnamed protein product [Acanthoscelides obtectus]CAK1645051.1 hypothetical protein AOBTE_LOCUS14003 [Acanthoscelides obtectus]